MAPTRAATSQFEKGNISDRVPKWEPDLCIQCGNCSFVCPHAVIRAKFFHESTLEEAPMVSRRRRSSARGFPETRYSLQVYLEDCTGCNLCVDACPVKSPDDPEVRAINMTDKAPILERGQGRHRVLRDTGIQQPRRGRVLVCSRRAVPAAAVRVLRRLCWLR